MLAPSWSGGGFWPKKFWIQDPVFPEIRKNPDFRVLFDQFIWNVWVILTLNQICFNTNKFLDRVSGFPKIRKNRFPAKIIIKYLFKNVRIFMWKIAEMIALSDFKNPVTYYLLRRKGRATSKNVEGAQPPPPDSGFSR